MNNNLIDSVNQHWTEILLNVKKDLGMTDITYKTWLEPLKVSSIKDNTFIITSQDSSFSYDYIKSKYGIHLKLAISNFFNHEYDIDFKNSDELLSESINKTAIDRKSYSSDLNPTYTFENFVVGSSSNLAFSAALAVADSPGEFYNPLFIHGGAGLGKTHLMQAIGNYIYQNDPSKKVLYVTSEAFTNEIVRSIREGKSSPEETRNKYRNLDVLLIDDIQFIIGKESTQEEFFNTFNALRESKKQIVISSDKPPKEFTTLEERLRSRFDSGLVVDIQPPTYETRMAILKRKLDSSGIDLNEEILEYIAENVTSNIREMEGSLNKIVAIYRLQRLSKDQITLDVAKDALKSIISTKKTRKVDINYIAEIVAEHYNISINDIYSKNKSRNFAYPRQIVMYLARNLTSLSLTEIGELLGKKDHSTIIHGINKVTDDIKNSQSIADTIDILIKKINPQ
ncbi:MAG: chromosomal replication initiator protein DnaA [Lachnospiraceae bacterium]|nr:chromosomal replication initiator protein DnaA [Lachnospiraceae bacterium]